MTANAFDEDRQNAEKAGMNGHLSKPFDMQQLLTMLRRSCRRNAFIFIALFDNEAAGSD